MKWKKWFILLWVVIAAVSIGYSISESSIPTVELSDETWMIFRVCGNRKRTGGKIGIISKQGITMTDIYNASDLL